MNTAATKVRSVFAVSVLLVTISVLATTAQAQDAARAEYPDVPRGHWAYKAINTVSQSGAIEGMPDGSYNGDKAITRSEFVTSIARLFTRMYRPTLLEPKRKAAKLIRIRSEAVTPFPVRAEFPDVAPGNWAYYALDHMTQAGIVEGLPNGTFGAAKPLARYECAIAFARCVFRVSGNIKVRKSPPNITPYPDVPKNHWAFEAIRELNNFGIFEGFVDGNFYGGKPMSRYEFAVALARLLHAPLPF